MPMSGVYFVVKDVGCSKSSVNHIHLLISRAKKGQPERRGCFGLPNHREG